MSTELTDREKQDLADICKVKSRVGIRLYQGLAAIAVCVAVGTFSLAMKSSSESLMSTAYIWFIFGYMFIEIAERIKRGQLISKVVTIANIDIKPSPEFTTRRDRSRALFMMVFTVLVTISLVRMLGE